MPNFGQRAFEQTPPTGFEPLSTAELPDVPITKPSDHFQTILDTGANILTNAQTAFPNGLWWIKDRANVNQHQLLDSVRGGNLALTCPTLSTETAYVAPAGNSVAWCWKAGGAPVTNTDGTITSQVSANPTAGFSIVTYTGTGANATVGHGLGGVAPSMIIVKERGNANSWPVYHASIGNLKALYLNLQTGQGSDFAGRWNSTSPTSSVFSLGASIEANRNNGTYVAYCFAEVEGYSKIGSYVGNNNIEGPFVWCGFKPSAVLIKTAQSNAEDWMLLDAARDTYNPAQRNLRPNQSNSEDSAATRQIDFLSNGFKIRSSLYAFNEPNATIIFAAFAEMAFGGSNVSPAPAR